jgi:hypothetical protein
MQDRIHHGPYSSNSRTYVLFAGDWFVVDKAFHELSKVISSS